MAVPRGPGFRVCRSVGYEKEGGGGGVARLAESGIDFGARSVGFGSVRVSQVSVKCASSTRRKCGSSLSQMCGSSSRQKCESSSGRVRVKIWVKFESSLR